MGCCKNCVTSKPIRQIKDATSVGFPMGLMLHISAYLTIWKINIDPENQPFLVETHFPTPICQGLCEFTGGYHISTYSYSRNLVYVVASADSADPNLSRSVSFQIYHQGTGFPSMSLQLGNCLRPSQSHPLVGLSSWGHGRSFLSMFSLIWMMSLNVVDIWVITMESSHKRLQM